MVTSLPSLVLKKQAFLAFVIIEYHLCIEMGDNNPFISLPAVLVREVVENWLDARSVTKLDQAHCSAEIRRQFLDQLGGACLVIVADEKLSKPTNFVAWLQMRKMVTEHLQIPSWPNLALLSLIKRMGPRVTSVSFESEWRTTMPSSITFKDIFACFPSMVHVDWSNLALYEVSHHSEVREAVLDVARSHDLLHTIIARFMLLTDETVRTIVKHCNHLHYFDVCGCESITSSSICVLAASCPELRYLDINSTGVDETSIAALAQHCPNLTHLDAGDNATDEGACTALGEGCPKLTFLSCDGMNNADFNAIGQGCTKLQSLIAKDSHIQDDDDELVTVVQNCRNLTVLDVSDSEDIICVAFPVSWQLREFTAAYCPNLEDDGVSLIVTRFPLLQRLDVSYCELLTDDAAHAIAQHGDNLAYLNLEGCLEISVEGIRKIGKSCRNLQKVKTSLTKAEHRSVSGLYTRRRILLEWVTIEMRPWDEELDSDTQRAAIAAMVKELEGEDVYMGDSDMDFLSDHGDY